MAITLRGDGDTTFDNNIGIGTTSPGEALHVHATGTTQIAAEFEANNAQSYIEFTGTDSTQILYGRDGADACIQTAGNDVFKALSNGNCSIVDGNLEVANGHGIDFSGTGGSSPTSTLLDDYEEGTWTPVIKSGSDTITWSGGGNHTYTKIGNKVIVNFTLDGSTTSGETGDDFNIEGLPFTCGGGTNWRTVGTHFNFYNSGLRADNWPTFSHINVGASTLNVYTKTSATGSYSIAHVASVGAASYCFTQITYNVD